MEITPSEHTTDLKDILFDILKEKKVKEFTVSFDGSGDSGQIEDISLSDKILNAPVDGIKVSAGIQYSGGTATQLYEEAKYIRDVIDGVCYKVLEQVCGGWEINEGSYGEFKFDVKNRTVTLDFNERVMDVNSSEYTF